MPRFEDFCFLSTMVYQAISVSRFSFAQVVKRHVNSDHSQVHPPGTEASSESLHADVSVDLM